MRNFILYFLSVASFCLNISMIAQTHSDARQIDVRFGHLSADNGLSENEILFVLQDRKGFMWFGTGDGLNRYDGYQFTVYRNNPEDEFSLSNNFVLALCEDHKGNLWAGTNDGLNRFDPKTQHFTRFYAQPGQPGKLQDERIWYLCQDQQKNLWVGTARGGLHRFNFSSETFKVFQHNPNDPSSLSDDGIGLILEDREGMLWLGTERGGLNRFNPKTQKFKAYQNDPNDPRSLSNDYVWSLLEDRKGVLWVGTYQGGLNRFDRETGEFTRFRHHPDDSTSLSSDNVKALLEDRNGRLWVGTYGGGLNILNPDGKTFTRIAHVPNQIESLANNFVMTITQDHSGIIWVGTRYGGISRTQFAKGFQLYSEFNPESSGGNGNVNVWAVFEDPDEAGEKLWMGTRDGGLFHLNRLTGEIVRFQHSQKNPYSISSNHVTKILKDHKGYFWIGTGEGLNRFNPALGKFIRFLAGKNNNPNRLNHNYISDILEDTTDNQQVFWLGTRGGGLNRLNVSTGVIHHYRFDTTKAYNSEDYLMQIFPGQFAGERVFWLASYGGGLIRFHPESKQFYTYRYDPDDPHSLSNNYTLSIAKDQNGHLWVGTSNRLNRFDAKKERFFRYGIAEGLPNNTVYGILVDGNDYLWLATNNGIVSFDPVSGRALRNYDINDGLQGDQFTFNSGAYFKSQSGELFYGGTNGLTSFNPNDIRDNLHIPPIVITDFKLQNHSVPVAGTFASTNEESRIGSKMLLQSDMSETKEITLSYRDNVFSFEFAALDYTMPQKNKYAYMLEGFDLDWNDVGNQRTATYTNLDPGKYVFRVKGSNNDGIWNEKGTSVNITITPPWWQTWWAYLLFAAAGLTLLIAGRRYELNRQRLKHDLELEHLQAEKLSEIDRMKSSFFANISHEFRTPLTLIKGPIEKLLAKVTDEESRNDLQLVRKNCRRLLELINQLLELSRLESGRVKLRARREELVGMLRGMTLSFESLAELRGLALTFSGPDKPVFAYVERDKLEKIIANLLSNAIKFTPQGGKVTVSVTVSEQSLHSSRIGHPTSGNTDFVEIIIADTGIGISADQQAHIFDRFYQADDSATRTHGGTGIGLALVKDLVDLHNGEIFVTSELNVGARFIVRLPLGKAHLKPEEISDAESPLPNTGYLNNESETESLMSRNEKLMRGRSNPEGIDPVRDLTHSIKTTLSEKKSVILVVEDNPEMRQYICDSLKDSYRTIAAKDGKAGLKKALDNIPDLIISDVMMPEMDGFVLCEKLKTDEHTSHIPVILLTARASDENKLIGLETGADDYLTKPFNAPELRARIKNLIEQRRRLQKRFQAQITIEPGDITVTSMDKRFLEKAIDLIEQHIADTDFSADTFSAEMAMHRVHLNRKIKALTGQTTTLFIRSIRLKRAAQLLKQKSGNISEIAYDVGFKNPAFFANCFREQFGMSPSKYLRQKFVNE